MCAREYQPGELAPVVLEEASLDADLAACGGQLRAVPCRELAGLLVDADRWMFGTPAVVRELRGWLRLSPRHPRYAVDGLTDRAMAMTRAEAVGLAAVLAPAVYPVARRLGAPALLAAASKGLLRYDGSVLVLVGPVDGPADLVGHGRALLRVWLSLASRGLAVHPLSQLIDCAATAAALRSRLGLGAGESPLAVFRSGVTSPSRSARGACPRSVREVPGAGLAGQGADVDDRAGAVRRVGSARRRAADPVGSRRPGRRRRVRHSGVGARR
ncbi:hypothetical protein ACFQX7_33965 [Luedemannella flava]